MLPADEHKKLDTVKNDNPVSSTGRRPYLSESGPHTNSIMLKLTNHSTIDCPTRLSEIPHCEAIKGIAARYISVDNAGTAAINPKKQIYNLPRNTCLPFRHRKIIYCAPAKNTKKSQNHHSIFSYNSFFENLLTIISLNNTGFE
jgi:hypothetical protein